jgi:HEAT repeat protein
VTAPAPAPPKAKPGPSKKTIIGWTIVMLVGLALAWVIGFVVVPVWRARAAVNRCVEKVSKPDTELKQLGGKRSAARAVGMYLRTLGPGVEHRLVAVKMLTECGRDGAPVLAGVLGDPDPKVRCAAIYGLQVIGAAVALPRLKEIWDGDSDRDVRYAAQYYFAETAWHPAVGNVLAAMFRSPDAGARMRALQAMERGGRPPDPEAVKRAFRVAADDAISERLLDLLVETDDAEVPAVLLESFNRRPPKLQLAMMAAAAGHTSDECLALVRLGLRTTDEKVQRASLMRLLAFAPERALPVLKAHRARVSGRLAEVASAVEAEIRERRAFPFVATLQEGRAFAPEAEFPSQNGTVPMVSPDRKWVAYVETGRNRFGGSGGMGRSNMLSLTHIVGVDGRKDRVVSDKFLVSWLANSKAVCSTRDGYAAVTNLNGKILAEFGEPEKEPFRPPGDWRPTTKRISTHNLLLGVGSGTMPHSKRLPDGELGYSGEGAAFSPDGKWFGPFREGKDTVFLGANGARRKTDLSTTYGIKGARATWSPCGRHVLLMNIYSSPARVVNARTGASRTLANVDQIRFLSGWDYRKCRWDPWAPDGSRFACVRRGEVWILEPDGKKGRQLTFDGTRKAFPTFSPDGRRVAYLTWYPDVRDAYVRSGPSDLWVVDVETALAVRATARGKGQIYCLDWLNEHTLVFDRVSPGPFIGDKGKLMRLGLGSKGKAE